MTRFLISSSLLVCFFIFSAIISPVCAQSISLNPINTTVGDADEFFTDVWGEPRDFSSTCHVAEDFFVYAPDVIENGVWRGVNTVSGPTIQTMRIPILGTPLAYVEDCDKLGLHYPLNANKYTQLSYKVKLSQTGNFISVLWSNNRDYALDGAEFQNDFYHLPPFGSAFLNPANRWYLRNYDLTAIDKPSYPWSGNITGFGMHLNSSLPVGSTSQLDFMRITDPRTSPIVNISWNTSGGDADFDSVSLYADNDRSGFDGMPIAHGLPRSGSYSFKTGILEPGDWYIYAVVQRSNTNPPQVRDTTSYTGPIRINGKPTLTFKSPTRMSGMEYSRDEREDAWDMSQPSDIVNYNLLPGWNQQLQRGFHDPAITNGVFTAESDADPEGAAVSIDTNMLLATKDGRKVDTNRYRYFCYRMQLDTTNINRQLDLQELNDAGFVSRLIFFDSDTGYFSSTGGHQVVEKSTVFGEGLTTYCFDLWDDAIYEGAANWRNAGFLDTIRLDPVESRDARKFAVDWAGLFADNVVRDGRFEIEYETKDPDGDNLSISFYYDRNRSGFNGTLIGSTSQGSPGSGTYVWNTAGISNGTYYVYAVVNDGTNTNRFYTDVDVAIGDTSSALPPENTCGSGDCIFDELESTACVGTNGFLGQENIATVISRHPTPLPVTVQYLDAFGNLVDSVSVTMAPNLRQDFILSGMGLQPDTLGSVCVIADGPAGSWTGGLAIYKPDTRSGIPNFGERFDFALYYPFLNAQEGRSSVPLNTFHLGTHETNVVANWISISDAKKDGQGLGGVLRFYNSSGAIIKETLVGIPDGGRADFSGHDGLFSGESNFDAIGMAEFSPNGSSDRYYMSLARYFYDCAPGQGICNNFHAAFNIPYRPGVSTEINGGVATNNGEISILELTNTTDSAVQADVKIYNGVGALAGNPRPIIPSRGTHHVIVNGILPDNEFGSATVKAENGSLHAISLFYKLDGAGTMEYAYGAPLTASPGLVQVSSFNSFIAQQNSPEIVNQTDTIASVSLEYRDFTGSTVYSNGFIIPPRGTYRINPAPIPGGTYGTVIVNSNISGVTSRNYTSRTGSYVLPFFGQ